MPAPIQWQAAELQSSHTLERQGFSQVTNTSFWVLRKNCPFFLKGSGVAALNYAWVTPTWASFLMLANSSILKKAKPWNQKVRSYIDGEVTTDTSTKLSRGWYHKLWAAGTCPHNGLRDFWNSMTPIKDTYIPSLCMKVCGHSPFLKIYQLI